jgi:teichuronic acid biosynthesis glycosyltransferase TuaC
VSEQLRVLSLATLFPDVSRPNFGIFVEQSLRALARQPGIELTVVAPRGIPPWPLSALARYAPLRALPAREAWHDLNVLRPIFALIPAIGARTNPAAIARAVLRVVRPLHAERPFDVIDAQFFFPDGPAAQLIAHALRLPYSVKARGADISHWAQAPATRATVRAAAQGAAGLLAVAETLKADMIAAGMPGGRISVHYTGVDAARFHPLLRASARAALDLPADAPVMLTVGALIPRKQQALVIAALTHLPADTQYLIAGTGPDEVQLRALALDAGVAERVHLLGSVANAELPTLYAAADVMVLPSRSEGLANAWVEALACGTPLVLGDIPPAHEVIDADDAGRIAAPTATAIADAVRAVLANPPDRSMLSARTHSRFNWDRNGAELAAHLRRCCQRPVRHGSGGGI